MKLKSLKMDKLQMTMENKLVAVYLYIGMRNSNKQYQNKTLVKLMRHIQLGNHQ